MKENPDSVDPMDQNPRVLAVGRIRKVIWVNFNGEDYARLFFRKCRSGDLERIVSRNSRAALDFLVHVEHFAGQGVETLGRAVVAAVGTGGERAEYFVAQIDPFFELMPYTAFKEALFVSLESRSLAFMGFLMGKSRFRRFRCFRGAQAIAERNARIIRDG
jgi:hypothetical protein